MSQQLNYPLVCIGLPKTIDNDLAHTDNCPGFGSVAKYIAISIQEAALDIAGMGEDWADITLDGEDFAMKVGDTIQKDLDGDGEIGFNDFFLFAAGFGKKRA